MVDGLIRGATGEETRRGHAHVSDQYLSATVAIANAKLAYQRYLDLCRSTEWQALAARGAHPQRLLWASTSTKNPAYRDVRYVEELIGPETVNTLTPATLEAFRDHGRLRASLVSGVTEARDVIDALGRSGISLREVTDTPHGRRRHALLPTPSTPCSKSSIEAGEANSRRCSIGNATRCRTRARRALRATIDDWQKSGKARRLWARDASLWTGRDENRWLGWLDTTSDQLAHIGPLQDVAHEVAHAGVVARCPARHGRLEPRGRRSSAAHSARRAGFPQLHIFDSTVPAAGTATEESWTWRTRSSSCRASQARLWRPYSCSTISCNA